MSLGMSALGQGIYGDLAGFMPGAIQRPDGTTGAPSAVDLFPDIFDSALTSKMGIMNQPGLGGEVMPASYNEMFSSMWMARMNQPMVSCDSEGRTVLGPSWNEFETALRKGRGWGDSAEAASENSVAQRTEETVADQNPFA
ncbi:MAG: hypothetical protein U0003_02015 [Vampirovibrionales bacterium]